ncbi:hypothetical protein EMCRGX_G008306 [Ephydatia muelleri]
MNFNNNSELHIVEPYRVYSDVPVVARSWQRRYHARTLLILDPRDAYSPPSITTVLPGNSWKMLETSRVEIDELPASIPWIVFDKARTVVKLFHTSSLQICSHMDQPPNDG